MPQTVRVYVDRLREHPRQDPDSTPVGPHASPSDPANGVACVVEVDWEDALAVCADVAVLDSLPVEVVQVEKADH
jgi:hypothetical protein